MLLWQRQSSNLTPQTFFKSPFFIASVVCHLIACSSFLVLYKSTHRLSFSSSAHIPTQAQVRLLPLSMKKPAHQQLGTKGGKKAGKSGLQKPSQKSQKAATQVVKQKSAVTLKKEKAQKKAAQKKREEALKATALKKEVAKQKQKKKVPEKNQTKEQELQKQQEPVVEKKEAVEEKIEPQSVVQDTKAEQVPAAKEQSVEGQEFIYVTQEELDALQMQHKLQECLFDLWTMPAGVSEKAVCEALVTVGWDGVLVSVEYLKKSSILLYDLSVQEALEQAHFPHEVWGKQLTIIFKP